MTLHSPQHLPARFRRTVGPLTRHIVNNRYRSLWRYRLERWRRIGSRMKAKLQEGKRYLWVCLGGLFVTVLMAAIGIAVFSSAFHVKEIRVRRTDLRMNMELVERIVRPFFGRHLLFLRTGDMKDVLMNAMPDVDDVSLRKEYPAHVWLDITLKPIIVRVMLATTGEERQDVASGTGEILDFLIQDGRYMQYRSTQVPHWSDMPVVHLVDWGIKPQPGRFLLEPHVLENMFEAESILRERFGQNVQQRTVFVRGREFHMKMDRYTLWLDDQSSLSDQFERYTLFLKKMGGDLPLQYIDLRLRDRVVYR